MISFLIFSGNDSGHDIDVIIFVSVISNRHNGTGISFKSFICSKILRFLLSVFIRSTNFFGSQLSSSLVKH